MFEPLTYHAKLADIVTSSGQKASVFVPRSLENKEPTKPRRPKSGYLSVESAIVVTDKAHEVVAKSIHTPDRMENIEDNGIRYEAGIHYHGEILSLINEIIVYLRYFGKRLGSQSEGDIFPWLFGASVDSASDQPKNWQELLHNCIALLRDAQFAAVRSTHPILVMQYLDGSDLTLEIERVGEGDSRYPVNLFVELLLDLHDLLAAFYAEGYISFGDMKPANLMRLFSGKLKLIDPALAVSSDPTQPQMGRVKSFGLWAVFTSPHYSSEEAEFKAIFTEKHDTYALAIMVYEWLVGKRLFSDDSIDQRAEVRTSLFDVRCKYMEGLADQSFIETLMQLEKIILDGLAQDPDVRTEPLVFLNQVIAALREFPEEITRL